MALHLFTIGPAVASQTRVVPTMQIVIALLKARNADFVIGVVFEEKFTAAIHIHDHYFRRVGVMIVIRVTGLLPDLTITELEYRFSLPPFEVAVDIAFNGRATPETRTGASAGTASSGNLWLVLLRSLFCS
jgi:hypothetical protein